MRNENQHTIGQWARAWAANGDGTAQHVEGEYAPLDGAA